MNICLCGTQQGYPHAEGCPFPYYGNSDAMISKWEDARAGVNYCACETPQPGYDGYCTNCQDPVKVTS